MTDYNDGNWHGWNGGECPVHPETLIDVTYPNGASVIDAEAGRFGWDNPLLFRIVKEHREPREFWLVGGYRFRSEKDAGEWLGCTTPAREIIHVREVLE